MNVRISLYLTILLLILLASCAPAATPTLFKPTSAPAVEKPGEAALPTQVPAPTQALMPTEAPAPAQTSTPILAPSTQAPQPTQAPAIISPKPVITAVLQPTPSPIQPPTEARIVQVEWPPTMRMGDSDIVKLLLVPSSQGYLLTTEFPEHQAITQTVQVQRPGGYELFAVARLDGVGFNIAPQGEQAQYLPENQPLYWRWSLTPRHTGQQRLTVMLTLRWVPVTGNDSPVREVAAYSDGLDVRVTSFLGLSQPHALFAGVIGLFLGGVLSLVGLFTRPVQRRAYDVLEQLPNSKLAIELPPGLNLAYPERRLLQTIFRHYARLTVEREFLSGYSGARTFLALPIRHDGRADAHTIAKIGERQSIRAEFENYETFVKDRLPPITARIQHPPVAAPPLPPKRRGERRRELAALQYTFIGEPGSKPTSLRQALLSNPDPDLLLKLLETFGPNWWMQRRPYTFRVAREYDRLLPTHLVLEPASGKYAIPLDGCISPSELDIQPGQILSMRNFTAAELRADGRSLSLLGQSAPGQPSLRVRWLSTQRPNGATGRLIATRQTLLRQFVQGFDLYGFPDPLERLPSLLNETISGSQSTIHGDLNLENILIGPGGLVWLIDFAQTREGHTLFDFAHLEAEVIAHILAPQIADVREYLEILKARDWGKADRDSNQFPSTIEIAVGGEGLLVALHNMASRCLFNLSQPREYRLALIMACLGALKFTNLDTHAKELLYITAAFQVEGF